MARCLLKRQHPFEEPSVNLTPLIDVVFVILIMFIVLAPLLELEHVDSRMPPPHQTRQCLCRNPAPFCDTCHRDNSIVFRQKKLTLEALVVELKEAKKDHPKYAFNFSKTKEPILAPISL